MRILVDTSVWVDFLRQGERELTHLLDQDHVEMHPFVIGELACGALPDRAVLLEELRRLPRTVIVQDDEAIAFLELHRFHGQGLGWIDVHLLASAMVSGARLWSRDKALAGAAEKLKIAF
jgi:predicted nucleic acid-binding protein